MRTILSMLTALAMAAALPAQTQIDTEYALYGGTPNTTDWEVRRTVDADADGLFTSGGEWDVFSEDGNVVISFVNDMRYAMWGGEASVFASSGADAVIRMVDNDADGFANSAGEVEIFGDFNIAHPGAAFYRIKGVDVDANGRVFVSNDAWSGGPQTGAGITVFTDLNGDGDANDAGEQEHLVDGTGTHSVAGTAGQVTIGITDFEALMVDGAGVCIGFEQQDLVLYAFQDMNGDGDAMDAGEAWNFCNLIDNVPGLEVNADIASGLMQAPRCVSTSGTGWFGSLEALSVDRGAGPGGADVYWITSTASNSSCNGGNGFVYQGIDNNGDGDLNDAGEVTLFLDGANNNWILYPVTSIWDGYHHDGGYSIFQGAGPVGISFEQDTVYFFEDLNGDGDGMDINEEQLRYWWEPDGAFTDAIAALPFGAFGGGPGGPSLSVANLVAGQTATISVSGASPGGTVGIAYSLVGAGPTNANAGACGTVTVDLSNPITILPFLIADAAGNAVLNQVVPAQAAGLNVWLHGLDVQSCTLTNPLAEVIG